MNLLDNKVLLWSAGICALTTFPILYIPCVGSSCSPPSCDSSCDTIAKSCPRSPRVISDYVFQLVGIGYEWSVSTRSVRAERARADLCFTFLSNRGIVGGCLIAYFIITELWKFARRKMNPDKIAKRPGAEDNEKGMARYDTVADDVFPEKAKKAFGKQK
jgi:hypothetical protein